MPSSSTFFKALLAAFVVTLIGDYLWHNVLLLDFYTGKLAGVNGGTVPDFSPSILVLEVLSSAVTAYFVLVAARKGTMAEAAFHGGLLGLAMVGAINFLNHALVAGWDTTLVSVDTAFGVILGALAGVAVLTATKR